jgi:hypothetical protein
MSGRATRSGLMNGAVEAEQIESEMDCPIHDQSMQVGGMPSIPFVSGEFILKPFLHIGMAKVYAKAT